MFALDAGGLALHLRRLQPVTQALLRSRNNSPPRLEPLPRQVLHHVGGFLAVHAEPGFSAVPTSTWRGCVRGGTTHTVRETLAAQGLQ
jgi:hypothetical protein